MKLMSAILTGILLAVSIGFAPVAARSVTPDPPLIASWEWKVYVSFIGEALSEGARAVKMANLQENMRVLEGVFKTLQQRGKLNPEYRALHIKMRYHQQGENSPVLPAAVLSLAPSASKIMGPPVSLGPIYVIDTTLFALNDLIALLLLLPDLNRQNPSLTIKDSVALAPVKESQPFQELSTMRLDFGIISVGEGPWGVMTLRSTWENGVFGYDVEHSTGERVFSIAPSEYYLARHAWTLPAPRLLAAATATALYLVELPTQKHHRLAIATMFPPKYLAMTSAIVVALDVAENHLYLTLSRDLPESFWQNHAHTYRLILDTGEIAAVASVKVEPKVHDPASPPRLGRGLHRSFYGDVSVVHHNRPHGWRQGHISRQEGFITTDLAQLLPRSTAFVFLPTALFDVSSFMVYGTQAELVVVGLVQGEYHGLNLRQLRPADYQKISAITIAQHPLHLGDVVYFVLKSGESAMAAYVWNLLSNQAQPTTITLAEKQSMGWREIIPWERHRLLPARSRIVAGDAVTAVVPRLILPPFMRIFLPMSVWVLLLFFALGLPFVLAHAVPLLLATMLNQAKLLFTFGPTLTTALFIGLSLLAIRLTQFHIHDIRRFVGSPLIWYYHGGRTFEILISIGFFTAAIATLAMLVFQHARLLPKVFFPSYVIEQQEKRAAVVSASVLYSLALALLILVLYFAAAFALPIHRLPEALAASLGLASMFGVILAAAYFLLRAAPAAAGHLAAAAAFLAVGYVTIDNVRMFSSIADYGDSFMGVLRQLFTLEGWLRYLPRVVPLALICVGYIARRVTMRRGLALSLPQALALAALSALPVIAIIIFARLAWLVVPRLGDFAIPLTIFLFTLIAVVLFAALALVFVYPIVDPVAAAKTTPPAESPSAKKPRVPLGWVGVGVAGLLVFLHSRMDRGMGAWPIPINWLLLFVQLYLAVALVFYFGRFLTMHLARALFTPERVSKIAAKL